MVKRPLRFLVYLSSAVLFFLGIVFMISTNLGLVYFFEGLIFFAAGTVLLVLSRERKTIEIKQTVDISGAAKLKEIRCPTCNAMIDPTKVEVIDGKPYLTCSYCSNKFELSEEPTW